MRKLFLLTILMVSFFGNAQNKKPKTTTSKPKALSTAQVMPEFIGGKDSMNLFIMNNLNYPTEALESEISGTVKLRFIVLASGEITDVKVISKELGGGLEEEAIRLVKSMPKWKPGRQNGKAVAVYVELPFKFKIN